MAKKRVFTNPEVEAIFESYPSGLKRKLLFLRQLIFDVASRTDGVGALEETLKWGQPSYLTTESKSGSQIRIDQVASKTETYAMYFHCQTTLVDTFREMYRDQFVFDGNRSIIFTVNDALPVMELSHCISLALTYHLRKKLKKQITGRQFQAKALKVRKHLHAANPRFTRS